LGIVNGRAAKKTAASNAVRRLPVGESRFMRYFLWLTGSVASPIAARSDVFDGSATANANPTVEQKAARFKRNRRASISGGRDGRRAEGETGFYFK
jgi:hypothetical protein